MPCDATSASVRPSQPVTLEGVKSTIPSALRDVGSAVIATARQIPRSRLVILGAAAVIFVSVVLWVPVPTAVELRDWASSVGPWLPLAFLGAHTVVTVFPFPRTAFTLAAGLLFGPYSGVAIAVTASTLSALLALTLVRALGLQLSGLVSHPKVDMVDARLRERGWPAVLSLRMIPAVPFSVVNYAASASAVPPVQYALATLAGLVPGTTAVVLLGDALTGNVSPLLLMVSVCTASLGIAGLVYEARAMARHHAHHAGTGD